MDRGFKVFLIVLGLIIGLFIFLKYRREGDEWIENIQLLNGDKIKVYHDYSHRAMYGPLHFLIGGGDPQYEVSFKYKNKLYKWNCLHIPIVIQFWEKTLYIVMLDKSRLSDIKLRFYKYEDSLDEIKPEVFPKFLAIQNRWGSKEVDFFCKNVPVENYTIDPKNKTFHSSIQAKIWARLEYSMKYSEIGSKSVDEALLKKYKQKYIDTFMKKLQKNNEDK